MLFRSARPRPVPTPARAASAAVAATAASFQERSRRRRQELAGDPVERGIDLEGPDVPGPRAQLVREVPDPRADLDDAVLGPHPGVPLGELLTFTLIQTSEPSSGVSTETLMLIIWTSGWGPGAMTSLLVSVA